MEKEKGKGKGKLKKALNTFANVFIKEEVLSEANKVVETSDKIENSTIELTEDQLELIAAVSHQANKAFCESIGVSSTCNWANVSEDKKNEVKEAIKLMIDFPQLRVTDNKQNNLFYAIIDALK
jgi:uncharacterized protein (DUF4415 family)